LVTERIGRIETGKRQQEKRWREMRQKRNKEIKENDGGQGEEERKNNLVIKGLEGKRKKNLIENAQKFLEKEFEVKEGVKDVQIA